LAKSRKYVVGVESKVLDVEQPAKRGIQTWSSAR
jgi:hypothetical protein